MDEELSFGKRMKNLVRIHWNGLCYIIVPLVFLPMVFMEPNMEFRTLFIMMIAFCWYATEAMTPGIIALMPIIFYPLLGVLSSDATCMAYARDSQMVYSLSFYIGIAIFNSKLDRYFALRFLKLFGIKPTKIITILMIMTYLLSSVLPDACACSIMMPLAGAILQILEEIDVCKRINENIRVDDDEKPRPSNVAYAFYIGVAYAAIIGGITNLWGSEAGFELVQIYNDIFLNFKFAANIHMKYVMTALPFSIILLVFTIVYLKILFLGLMRSEDKKITFNSETCTRELEDITASESGRLNLYRTLTLLLVIFFLVLTVVVKVFLINGDKEEVPYIKYSMYLMLVCFLAFVCPNSCDFCNYFICRKPSVYKTAPSILPWSPVNKYMAWDQFFVYGSGMAFGVAIDHSGLYLLFGEGIVKLKSVAVRQLCFMLQSVLLSIIAANQLVAYSMMQLGAKSGLYSGQDPSLFTIPIVLASSLSFLMPVSSVPTSFATGWGNLRTRKMIKVGIVPLIFGYILIFLCIYLASSISPEFPDATTLR